MEGLPCQWGNIYKITDMFYPRIVSIFQKGMKEAIYILAEKFALDRDQGWYQLPAVYNSLFQSHAQSSFQGGVHWTHKSLSFYLLKKACGYMSKASVSATLSFSLGLSLVLLLSSPDSFLKFLQSKGVTPFILLAEWRTYQYFTTDL